MTVCSSEQYEDTCKGQFGELHVKLDRMDESIRGNGKPGIQVRLDRLESSERSRSRLIWIILSVAATLAVSSAWQAILAEGWPWRGG